MGNLPINSGIKPNLMRSLGSTKANNSSLLNSFLSEILALKPIVFSPSLLVMI